MQGTLSFNVLLFTTHNNGDRHKELSPKQLVLLSPKYIYIFWSKYTFSMKVTPAIWEWFFVALAIVASSKQK